MYAVYAREKHPPKGEAAIEWMLLTSLPVESHEMAKAIIGWYCQIEELRLEADKRLLNCIVERSRCAAETQTPQSMN